MSATFDFPSLNRPPTGGLPGDHQRHQGVDSMESKIDRNRPITSTADVSRVRADVKEMFTREKARGGGKMVAYRTVGRQVGRSSSWVRRFLAEVDVGLSYEVWCRIRAAYIAYCERIEAEAEAAKNRAAVLRAQANELERHLERGARR